MIINSINESADRKFFNKWLRDNYTIDAIIYSDIEVNIVFNDEPIQAIQDIIINKYNSLTIADITTFNVISIYQKRQADGIDFFQEQRAHLYIKLTTSEITMPDAFFIELKLKNVKDYVITGDWLTAQNEINSVIVEGAYTQAIHDSIKDPIDAYVTANYSI